MNNNIFHGIPASPGIGIGKIFLLEKEELYIVRKSIRKEEVKKEIQRFRKALEKSKKEFREDKIQMLKILGKSHAKLADAYLMILEDPILTTDVEKEIAKELVNAEYVVWNVLNEISRTFDALQDDFFKERKNDIQEVGQKLLRDLLGKKKTKLAEMTEESIVVAHNLLPSDTVALKTGLICGFAIDVGGKTSHTALLAQSLEIPAVVGLKDITGYIRSGQTLIVDGNQGLVIIDPDPATLANYVKEREVQVREKQELVKIKDLPAQTLDGKKIELAANIETADDVKAVQTYGAQGIGLFRTEYLFMNRTTLPSEEEQYESYSKAVKRMHPHPVIFRTLDIGGDKLSALVNGYTTEVNPFLGLRAIRFCLKYPEIFRTQLKALLRAAADGKIRIMFPMVGSLQEFLQGKDIFESAKKELMHQNIPFDSHVELGTMIEVPSAALTADVLAKEMDFFSIGTNDLIQYTLAIDRVNENVASFYDPMNLSILRLIKMVVDAAHENGKWVGMCGEMASDTQFTQLLMGLGLDELSVVPSFTPKIKKIIRSTNYSEARRQASEILTLKDPQEIRKHLDQMKAAQI